jgi:hypothetical protein
LGGHSGCVTYTCKAWHAKLRFVKAVSSKGCKYFIHWPSYTPDDTDA